MSAMQAHYEAATTFARDNAVFAHARRLRQEADFELLKSRMMLEAMDKTPRLELHVLIFRAAAEAAGLAWQTPFPSLVFPGLFEEIIHAAFEQAHQRSVAVGWKLSRQ